MKKARGSWPTGGVRLSPLSEVQTIWRIGFLYWQVLKCHPGISIVTDLFGIANGGCEGVLKSKPWGWRHRYFESSQHTCPEAWERSGVTIWWSVIWIRVKGDKPSWDMLRLDFKKCTRFHKFQHERSQFNIFQSFTRPTPNSNQTYPHWMHNLSGGAWNSGWKWLERLSIFTSLWLIPFQSLDDWITSLWYTSNHQRYWKNKFLAPNYFSSESIFTQFISAALDI